MRNFDAREKFGFNPYYCFAQVSPENAQEILDFLNEEAEKRGVFDLDEFDQGEADLIKEEIWEKHCNTEGYGPKWVVSDESRKIWYAVLEDNEDNDWGYGSHDLDEAKKMVEAFKTMGYNKAYIAVIDETADPICIEEIR